MTEKILCHFCDSDAPARFVDEDDGVEIFQCRDCGEFFENDTFVAHPKKINRNRKFRDTDED